MYTLCDQMSYETRSAASDWLSHIESCCAITEKYRNKKRLVDVLCSPQTGSSLWVIQPKLQCFVIDYRFTAAHTHIKSFDLQPVYMQPLFNREAT